jgi:hypothetical protein
VDVRGSTGENRHISAVLHGDGLTVLQWRILTSEMKDPEEDIFSTSEP